MPHADNLMASRPEALSLSTGMASDDETHGDLWSDIFPFEILCFRSMLTNKTFLKYANIAYSFYIVISAVYIAVRLTLGTYVNVPISLMILLHLQGFTFLIIPYVCYWYFKRILFSPDLKYLIAHAVQFDSGVKLKLACFTHFSFLCLIFAALMYVVQSENYDFYSSGTSAVLVCCITVFYLGPLNAAACLAVCIIEFHRINIQQFRHEINGARALVDNRYWKQTVDLTRYSAGDTTRESELKMDSRCLENFQSKEGVPHISTTATDHTSEHGIREMRDKYRHLYGVCSRSSLSFGLYLLFFLYFGFLYAVVTLYSVYLGEYPSKGLMGFVFVGFFVSLSLGAAITACNETGHLVCRDLSGYLISLPHLNENCLRYLSVDAQNTFNTMHDGAPDAPRSNSRAHWEEDNRQDCLALMSAMSFMKLQICYVGNMALRSSVSFAVVGSLLAAAIPVLIEKEG